MKPCTVWRPGEGGDRGEDGETDGGCKEGGRWKDLSREKREGVMELWGPVLMQYREKMMKDKGRETEEESFLGNVGGQPLELCICLPLAPRIAA